MSSSRDSSGSRSSKRVVFSSSSMPQDGPAEGARSYRRQKTINPNVRQEAEQYAASRAHLAEDQDYKTTLSSWETSEPRAVDYYQDLRAAPKSAREVQLAMVANKFAGQFGFLRAWYIEELRKLDYIVLALVYADPRQAIMGSRLDLADPVAADGRVLAERMSCRLSSLQQDALRCGALADGAPILRVMLQCHPTLYGRYAQSMAQIGTPFQPPPPSQEQQHNASVSLKTYSALFNIIAVQRHKYLVQRDSQAQLEQFQPNDMDLRNLLAQFPTQDAGKLKGWLTEAGEKVYGPDPTLAEVALKPDGEEYDVNPIIAPPTATAGRHGYDTDCPLALAAMQGVPPTESCPYPFCALMLPIDASTGPSLVHRCAERRHLYYYSLAEARKDGRAVEGPFNLLEEGHRCLLIYSRADQWTGVEKTLRAEGFFSTVSATRIMSIHTTGWSNASYRKAGFKTHQPPKEAFTVLAVAASNGVVLAIRVLSGGLGEDVKGVQIPPSIVKMMESDSVRKYQFNVIHDRRCLNSLNVQVRAICDATNRAAFAFPQPLENYQHLKTGAEYVATQLGLPTVFEPVRPERKNDKRAAKELVAIIGDNLAVKHNNKTLINVTHLNYAKEPSMWEQEAVLYLFYEAVLPLIFLTREATAIMENLALPDEADVTRWQLFLLDQVQDKPQLSSVQNRQLKDVRPFGHAEFMAVKTAKPGPAYLYLTEATQTVNSEKEVLQLLKMPPMYRPVDMSLCTPYLKSVLLNIADVAQFSDITLNTPLDLLFDSGPAFPHRCQRCGSTSHCTPIDQLSSAAEDTNAMDPLKTKVAHKLPVPQPACQNKTVKCVYPPCQSNDHVMAVCPLLMEICKRCEYRGHRAYHHMSVPFLRLIEDFMACAPFHANAISLIPNITWYTRAMATKVAITVEINKSLQDVVTTRGLPLAYMCPQVPEATGGDFVEEEPSHQ